MRKLQFTFPKQGQWDKFRMTALYRDSEGYQLTKTYSADDIPDEQKMALVGVITAIAGLGEPWQATQVWVRLTEFVAEQPEDEEPVMQEAVELTVEAVSTESGGRRVFTVRDYPAEFLVLDEAVVEFFKYFTK